jgi:hypothetical protein
MGLFGLGDPVFSLQARDRWIGWSNEDKKDRLRYIMDAFVLGAVPPYSNLLCGKLIAMLAASDEVRDAFRRRYGGSTSRILGRRFPGELVALTTNSALGRSSLYNRLSFQGSPLFRAVGYTAGSGEFHFANGLYSHLKQAADELRTPSAKHPDWGAGWRSRRELLRSILPLLGLSSELIYHGVRRQVFVAPLAENANEFLSGRTSRLVPKRLPFRELFTHFRERWLLPRARRDDRYLAFDPASLRLWS